MRSTFAFLLSFLSPVLVVAATPAARPNVVIILADDMGYSDIGCYGGEIPTPHLDALAKNGLRFTQFYNTARCSPTRAALLTGLHPHQAGMGTLAEDPGKQAQPTAAAGYREVLGRDAVTIAEVLRPAGYRTYLAGKWHLGYHGVEKWPLARGFERFYGLISGASSYHLPTDPRGLTLDNTPLPPPTQPGYYTTDAFTDHALEFLAAQRATEPFFLYLAFTAPHWPLHAREEDIKKFVGRYRGGWDQLRAQRFARQQELGVVPANAKLSPRDDGARAWDALSAEEQTQLDYRMAVYAAQVHRMDHNIGRLVAQLRARGQLDNTLIFFLTDNGGCAEPYSDLGGGAFSAINQPAAAGSGGRNAGTNGSSYGTGWANASNTPFRRYKARLHQGGISTPLIAHWPAGLKTAPGSTTATLGYLTDFMPTVLELSGAAYPAELGGQRIQPLVGRSLAPVLRGGALPADRWLYWEQYNNKAVRHGHWKAVQPAEANSPWELYDLSTDPTELNNLAASRADKLRELTAAWEAWATSHRVLPKTISAPGGTPKAPRKKS
ncbi:MAG: arylsulfatase [Opitutaceae bacterium]|nr:arylsulfatase [Opitutaceae bacterium]